MSIWTWVGKLFTLLSVEILAGKFPPSVYSLTIELNDKSSCNLGVFAEDEYCLAKMMMDKIKEGLANNTSFLDLDDYLKMWKKKLKEEKETKNG